jgi:hypothetical protein
MADRGTATFKPTPAFNIVTDYDPITRGSGDTVDPKRYLLTAGGWVPIQ